MDPDTASKNEVRDGLSPQVVSSELEITKSNEDVIARCATLFRERVLDTSSFMELKKFLKVSTWMRTKNMAEATEEDGRAKGTAVKCDPQEGDNIDDSREASTTTADERGTRGARVETNVTVDGKNIHT